MSNLGHIFGSEIPSSMLPEASKVVTADKSEGKHPVMRFSDMMNTCNLSVREGRAANELLVTQKGLNLKFKALRALNLRP